MVIFDSEAARIMARDMTVPTVDEARRVLHEEGYEANLDEIGELVRAREALDAAGPQLIQTSRWKRGEKVLVAARGAVFLAIMKEPGPKKATVRLVHDDAWHETAYDNLFTIADTHRAVVKGLQVLP